MIRKPNNWNEVTEMTERPKLPLGAYVCKIVKAAVETNSYGDQLIVGFDIAEGDYANFYRKDFDSNTAQNKKWRGQLRLWLPKDDGSDKDEITKRVLKGFVSSVEKSNLGYQFDWNEASLAGKMVGILFRNEEYDFEGKHGWAVRPFRALSCASVREGSFTLPNDKPLNPLSNTSTATMPDPVPQYNPNNFVQVDDDELPF